MSSKIHIMKTFLLTLYVPMYTVFNVRNSHDLSCEGLLTQNNLSYFQTRNTTLYKEHNNFRLTFLNDWIHPPYKSCGDSGGTKLLKQQPMFKPMRLHDDVKQF
jgi:hypothetical protein